jgi:alpha-beta hydrolase superfamily lysophospholipase/SAM-dependent methyltransferase
MPQWQEASFTTFDGLTLFYRYRQPQRQTKNTLLILHRGHEHSGRMMPSADKLSEGDFWCFSFDLRGHGLSQGERAWAPDFNTWVKDLNSFAGHLNREFGIQAKHMLLIANSVSSVMALSWVLDYGANIKGCILVAPAFSIKLYIPLALPALRLLSRFSSHQFVTSYVKSRLLTRDKNAAKEYDSDPLITQKIGVNVLTTLFATTKRCFKRLKDFETPVLVLSAGDDYIVHNKPHRYFIKHISSRTKQHIVLEGFRHALFFEKHQDDVIKPCKAFINSAFSRKAKQLPAVIPKARPHTQAEHQALLDKGSKTKQFYYTSFRYLLTRVGRYSHGVSLGLQKGFDSGVILDYVYQNTPAGDNFIGKLIDKMFLNSIGWRGVRTRKKHLKSTLQAVTQQVQQEGHRPIIFDVASGAGRYLFEIQQEEPYPVGLHLNDIDTNAIALAKTLASGFNAQHCSFTCQDVFALKPTTTMSPRPNIVVISGLFELYENNTYVYNVLANVLSLLEAGGYLVYTGQPWHPQIELIGRLLNNRQGDRWVMRRRIQAEMDQLVTSVGFHKQHTETDALGIFTVSCAQKATPHTNTPAKEKS